MLRTLASKGRVVRATSNRKTDEWHGMWATLAGFYRWTGSGGHV